MKKPGTWIMIFFLILSMVSIIFYFVRKENEIYPDEIITRASEMFRPDLKGFLAEVNQTVMQLEKNAKNEDIDELTSDSLNVYFSKLISGNNLLKGIVIFGSNMNYVIIRDNDSWVITHNTLLDSSINWKRYDKNLHFVREWTDTYNFFMDQHNFNSINIKSLKKGDRVWHAATSQLPDRRELLFSILKLNTKNDMDVVALMFKTSDLSSRFYHVLVFENPMVTIQTTRNELVTPIKTKNPEEISTYDTLEKKIKKLYATWNNTPSPEPHSYSFQLLNKVYWTRIDTIQPFMGVKAFSITASESDLIQTRKKAEQAYLYAAIMFALFALFVYLNSYRKRKNAESTAKSSISSLTGEELLKLIENGETEYVEFKSSLRWDYREEKVNKALEDVILKSIAAFSNAKGGTLLIGVNDNMEVIGLEPDFKTLKKQDADYFELHIRRLINNQFGIRFANKHLLIQFPEFGGKIICVVYISPGDFPLYLKTKNKQGQEIEKFYVRSGNASQEITSLKEIHEYVTGHFNL